MDEEAQRELRAKRAAYAREWRARPGNTERARASNKRARENAKAKDPDGFKARQRARYQKYISEPEAREKHRAQGRARYAAGRSTRRGLTISDRHDYWVHRSGLCDFCGQPCADPAEKGAWKVTVVDHDNTHCATTIGCRACVRAQGHRPCNVMEGVIRAAMARGLISGYWGRLNDILADPPMQRWLASRTT